MPANVDAMSRVQVFELIKQLKASESAKSSCGLRLIARIEDYSRGLAQ